MTATAAEKADKAAVTDAAAIAASEAKFQETVAKAADDHQAVVAAHSELNLAEAAWNATKSDEGPVYKSVSSEFRSKLDFAVESIQASGIASGIAGLEAFDAEVFRLLDEQKKANEALTVKKADKSASKEK